MYKCVYTITLNPSIDYIMNCEDLEVYKTNKSKTELCRAGGKGINVSFVLKNLGVNTKALGFAGGFVGDEIIRELSQKGIDNDFVRIKDNSRINVKIDTGYITEINGSGPVIDNADLLMLKKKLSSISKNDFVVFSGSIPKGVDKYIYSELADMLKCPFAVDTSGEALLFVLKNKPFLVKPNIDELGELFDVEIKDYEDAAEYGTRLIDIGAENVIVSMGENGAVYIDSNRNYFVHKGIKGDVKNTVGAGDSMVGGFLYGIINGYDNKSAFDFAVACGSACAFCDNLPDKKDIFKYVK